MIRKLDNGNTLITLGEGTVFSGNVSAPDDDKPFGIYFTNEPGKTKDAVIIQISSNQAIAAYVMALVRFIEANADPEMTELNENLQALKTQLEPLMPKAKIEQE